MSAGAEGLYDTVDKAGVTVVPETCLLDSPRC